MLVPCLSEGDMASPSTDSPTLDVPSSLTTELPDQIPRSPHGGDSGAQNGTALPEAVEVNRHEQQHCNEGSEAKTDGFINDVCDNDKLHDSTMSENGNGTESVNADVGNDLKRRVQWNDCHGKELVHIKEFDASDTSDSEDEDDETESHSCTCTIL